MTSIFYYTARIDFRQCISRFSGDFPLFFARFGPENFPVAPNQHHSFGTCSGEPGNTGLSLLPVVCFHIHSKTACRGFKSFCPCQKSQVSLVRYLTFFVSVRKDLATRCARRLSCGACRGALVACGDRPAPTEAAAETSPSLDFLLAFRVFSSGLTRSQLFPSPPAPKTHPVSPFSGFSGCVFSIFAVFRGAKFLPWFLCNLRIVLTN